MSKPERERDEPATRQRAVRRDVRVDHEQRDAEQDEREPAHESGRTEKPKSAAQEADRAERAGQDDARVEDLEADPGDAGEEEQREEVRVDQRVEEAREEARLRRRRSARPRVCSVKALSASSCGRRSVAAAPAATARSRRSRSAAAPRSAVRFDALRTAASAHAALRPCVFASARSEAAASFTTLRRRSLPMFEPLELIGVDEPMFVPAPSRARRPPARSRRRPTRRARRPARRRRSPASSRQLGLHDLPHRRREAAGRVEQDHGRVVAVLRGAVELAVSQSCVTGLTSAVEVDREHARPRRGARGSAARRARARARGCENRFHGCKDCI